MEEEAKEMNNGENVNETHKPCLTFQKMTENEIKEGIETDNERGETDDEGVETDAEGDYETKQKEIQLQKEEEEEKQKRLKFSTKFQNAYKTTYKDTPLIIITVSSGDSKAKKNCKVALDEVLVPICEYNNEDKIDIRYNFYERDLEEDDYPRPRTNKIDLAIYHLMKNKGKYKTILNRLDDILDKYAKQVLLVVPRHIFSTLKKMEPRCKYQHLILVRNCVVVEKTLAEYLENCNKNRSSQNKKVDVEKTIIDNNDKKDDNGESIEKIVLEKNPKHGQDSYKIISNKRIHEANNDELDNSKYKKVE